MYNSLPKILLLLPVLIFILTGCSHFGDRERLLRAQMLLEQELADSAVHALDSIKSPQKMGEEYYMQYVVTNAQAKYKADQDIQNDTAVFEAVRYFEKKKDGKSEQLIAACYIAGIVCRVQGEADDAIYFLRKALDESEHSDFQALRGLIFENLGYISAKEMLYSQAVQYYKNAFMQYKKSGGSELKQSSSLRQIGTNFLQLNNTDSALFYYQKAIAVADSIQDKRLQASLRNNIGLAYKTNENYEQSINYLKEALRFNSDSLLSNKIRLNIAENYYYLDSKEELKHYIALVQASITDSTDLYYRSAVLNFLSMYESSIGNYKKALGYSEQDMQIHIAIFEKNQSDILIDAEEKYDYTKKETEAIVAKQQLKNYIVISISLLILGITAALFIRYREKQKLKAKELLLKAESEIHELRNHDLQLRLKQYNHSISQYKILIQNTRELHGIIYDTAEIGRIKEKSSTSSEIINSLNNTEKAIIRNMSENSQIYFDELNLFSQSFYAVLKDEDIVLLYYLYTGENRTDIAAFLNIKPHALTQRISRLRDKIRPHLSDADFKAFFQ